MNFFAHALASLALARAAIPRAPLPAWALIIAAGTVADLDALSALGGPTSYLAWHYTYVHSLTTGFVAAALLSAIYVLFVQKFAACRMKTVALFGTAWLAAWVHAAMDGCQSDGVTLFWPFSARRVARDWVASVDPWIIAILIAAVLVPELLRLVSKEIGAKDKRPRGHIGAIIGLIAVVMYFGLRATLHSNVVAAVDARSYGEPARRSAAFPESASLITWHAIVETESALRELTVSAAPGAPFNAEGGINFFKPEASPALDQARESQAAKIFLGIARFPKATVEKTQEGYAVQIRDLRYAAAGETHNEIVAVIKLDQNSKILDDSLDWARHLRQR